MVKQYQMIEEYYYLDDDKDLTSMFYAPTYYTSEEQLIILSCLRLLEERFHLLQSMTLEQIIDEIDSIMGSLQTELSDNAERKVSEYIFEYLMTVLDVYGIPEGYVEEDTSMIPLMLLSLDGMVNQLHYEIKSKALFFKDNLTNSEFDITSNFKRAVQKTNDAVGNNLVYSEEKNRRSVYDFVYGKDKLYRWLTMNDDKVCDWCRLQEKMPPRLLEEIPMDHPHGRCTIEPIDYEYSDEYKILLARGEYSDAIEAFIPSNDKIWR